MLGNGFQRQYVWDTLGHRASWFRHRDTHILCSLGGCPGSATPGYGGQTQSEGLRQGLLEQAPLGRPTGLLCQQEGSARPLQELLTLPVPSLCRVDLW